MQICLLRVGIDTGCGGILGPLFRDGTFEYIPIPDEKQNGRRYGEITGKNTKEPLWKFFPKTRQKNIINVTVHYDPEFDTFTYGDPTRPKRSLRRLQQEDLLVFYAGLEPYDFEDDNKRRLYIIGYFVIQDIGVSTDFSKRQLSDIFGNNFHVKYRANEQNCILVKGTGESRLLHYAYPISDVGVDRGGHKLCVLSGDMKKIFGSFTKLSAIQRSTPRWVSSEKCETADEWIRKLR